MNKDNQGSNTSLKRQLSPMTGAGVLNAAGEITYEILHAHGCKVSLEEVQRRIVDVYNESIGAGEIKPTDPNLSKVLSELKARGKKLALVTTDNEVITGKCLSALGVCGLFDKIYTDDGKTPKKPDPFCAKDFCERMGVDASRVVMVGDTATDVRFARNAGISVIILAKDEKSKGCLSSQADAVIERISSLLQVVS